MIKTKYVCDLCKHEQDDVDCPRIFYALSISATQMGKYKVGMYLEPNTAHICDKCAGDKLLFKKPEQGVTPTSIEDLVREIAGEAAIQAISNR